VTARAVAVGGGRGFIGRAVALALGRAGAQVVAFGREGLSEQTCPEVHALVWAGGGREGGADRLAEEHVAAPLRALALAAARGARRAVYVSSGEVYGAQAVPFREDAIRLGDTPYARAKIRGEDAFLAAAARLGVAAAVVRPGVVYGPGQREGMLLPSLLAALRAGRRFACTAGAQTRDFVHVDDVARVIAGCLADEAPPGVYNAGTGIETRVADVVQALAWRLGGAGLVELGALPYRPGEVMRYALDPSRARQRLGVAAAVDLARGLEALARCPEEQADA
jgi:UDP-glucose 4-epimerase